MLKFVSELWRQRQSILENPALILNRPQSWKRPLVFAVSLIFIPCLIFETAGFLATSLALEKYGLAALNEGSDAKPFSPMNKSVTALQGAFNSLSTKADLEKIETDFAAQKKELQSQRNQFQLVGTLTLLSELIAVPVQFLIGAWLFKSLLQWMNDWNNQWLVHAGELYLYYYQALAFWFIIAASAGYHFLKVIDACITLQPQSDRINAVLDPIGFIFAVLPFLPVVYSAPKICKLIITGQARLATVLTVGAILFASLLLSNLCKAVTLAFLGFVWGMVIT